MEGKGVVLLTLLRILLVLTVLSYGVVFLIKEPSDKIVYIPYQLSCAYLLTMLFYHPLVGAITAGTGACLMKYFMYSVNHEEFKFRFEKTVLYIVLLIFAVSAIYTVIETCTGRLF